MERLATMNNLMQKWTKLGTFVGVQTEAYLIERLIHIIIPKMKSYGTFVNSFLQLNFDAQTLDYDVASKVP